MNKRIKRRGKFVIGKCIDKATLREDIDKRYTLTSMSLILGRSDSWLSNVLRIPDRGIPTAVISRIAMLLDENPEKYYVEARDEETHEATEKTDAEHDNAVPEDDTNESDLDPATCVDAINQYRFEAYCNKKDIVESIEKRTKVLEDAVREQTGMIDELTKILAQLLKTWM